MAKPMVTVKIGMSEWVGTLLGYDIIIKGKEVEPTGAAMRAERSNLMRVSAIIQAALAQKYKSMSGFKKAPDELERFLSRLK